MCDLGVGGAEPDARPEIPSPVGRGPNPGTAPPNAAETARIRARSRCSFTESETDRISGTSLGRVL